MKMRIASALTNPVITERGMNRIRRADTERSERHLERAREDGRSEQVLDAVVRDQRHHHQRHGTGRGGDHGPATAGEGDDDRDRERCIEADLRVDTGDDRERDRLGDQRQRDDEARQQVGAGIREPFRAEAARHGT